MLKTYRYRLFTNTNQERLLDECLETHRRLYNAALDGKRLVWEFSRTNWLYHEQSAWFRIARQTNKFFARLNYASAQQTLLKLDMAYKAFFAGVKDRRHVGHPRFKSRDRFVSFSYCLSGHGGGCKLVNGKLRLQNIGAIRIRWHREMPEDAVIKHVTIKRYAGNWYACFSVECAPIRHAVVPPASCGIDVGLKAFVATSNGDTLGDSRILEVYLRELRRKQRALSRCQRGSSRRQKVRVAVTKLHAHVANTRRDMHHKVARTLVNNYGAIVVERLNIKGMLRNNRLARRIADAGWGQFIGILKFKAEEAGTQVVEVSARNTSQECSACHAIVPKSLAERVHRCGCGLVLDRDHNAARNILARMEPRFANRECVPG